MKESFNAKFTLFLLGLLSGISLWIFIPYFFSGKEPWDNGIYVYIIMLFIIGLCIGFFKKWTYLSAIFGLYLGQWLICFLGIEIKNLAFSLSLALLFGSLYLLFFTSISFFSAFATNYLAKKYRCNNDQNT